jgi:L-cysteine S-thiosulfotransferase
VRTWSSVILAVAVVAGAATASEPPRTIAEARGDIRTLPDGTRTAVRYKGWTTKDYGAFRTYSYGDGRPEPAVTRATMPTALTGDAAKGRALFMSRAKAPCTGCHLVPGDDVWPAGNVGPDLSAIGDRGLSNDYLYAQIYDARSTFPNTTMPPWGATGVFTPEEIVHLVAYLQTLKGPAPAERDTERDPSTRKKPVGFGDNLDPTNNPAVLLAEGATDLWMAPGPTGQSCATCHTAHPETAMKGVTTRYPKLVKSAGRVMSVEDWLTVHGPTTTGRPMLAQSADNLTMAMLIRMASNGMPVAVDVGSGEARAGFERGRASFYRRVGERNHSCADCHVPEKGANKFLGGRLLADVSAGVTRHFPTWRTSQSEVWDIRKRFQWCMTPLGMNMLAADAVEYAELELYLASFDNGKPISVPGIRH